MQKPAQIYAQKHFLICNHPGFAKEKTWYEAPMQFFNWHTSDQGDITQDYIEKVAKDLWIEWVEETDFKWDNEAHLYVLEFDQEDEFNEVTEILEILHEKRPPENRINLDQYNALLRVLKMNKYTVKITKEQYYPDGTEVKFQVSSWLDWDDSDVVILDEFEEGTVRVKMTVDDLKLRNNQMVKIHSLETYSELGIPGYEYYNITFKDGMTLVGVSGSCLSKTKL